MIELVNKQNNMNLTKPIGGGKGEDGGYYIPSIDENGVLTWQPSQPDMPEVKETVIKSDDRIYIGSGDMPEGYDIQIDINGKILVYKPVSKTDKMQIEVGTDENGQLWASGVPTTRKIADIDLVDDITIEELQQALKMTPHTVDYFPPSVNTAGTTGELYFSIKSKQMYAMVDTRATEEGMVYCWVQLSNPEIVEVISEDCTDEQVASAKAIKAYVDNLFNSIVNGNEVEF